MSVTTIGLSYHIPDEGTVQRLSPARGVSLSRLKRAALWGWVEINPEDDEIVYAI